MPGFANTRASGSWRSGGIAPAGRPSAAGCCAIEELTNSLWLLTSPKDAPNPTEVQRAYVQASRAFETSEIEKVRAQFERTRRFQKRSAWALGSIALLVAAGAAYVLWQQRETDRRETLVLTSATDRAIADRKYDAAMRIAVQGLPSPGRSPVALGWSTHEVTGLEAKLAGAAPLSRLQRVLSGHTDAINSVDFSADGARIVSGSADQTARVWNAASGELLHNLKRDGPVSRVVFSPDGGRILTASSPGTVRIWDAASGKLLRELKVAAARALPLRRLVSVTFSADETRILIAMQFGRARCGASPQARLSASSRATPTGWRAPPSHTKRGGPSRGGPDTASIWDTTSGEVLHELPGHKDFIHAVAFSVDGTRIATGAGDRIARVGRCIRRAAARRGGHEAEIKGVSRSVLMEASLATASSDQTARLWNLATGEAPAPNSRDTPTPSEAPHSVLTDASSLGRPINTLRIWGCSGRTAASANRPTARSWLPRSMRPARASSRHRPTRERGYGTPPLQTMPRELPHNSQVSERP